MKEVHHSSACLIPHHLLIADRHGVCSDGELSDARPSSLGDVDVGRDGDFVANNYREILVLQGGISQVPNGTREEKSWTHNMSW